MKTILLTLVLLRIICLPSCFARLGEDEIQCEERYGFAKKEFVSTDKINPLITGEGANTRTYIYQGWRIRIGFLDGVAVREEYWKVTGPGRTVTIADYESTAILDGEKGNGTWKSGGQHLLLDSNAWVRSDNQATARIDTVRMHMSFEGSAAVEHDKQTKQANEQKQRASVPAF